MSVAEMAAVLATIRGARQRGLPVVIRGRGTTAGWLQAPAGSVVDLELAGLSGPVAINPENLSATFLAGTPLGALDAALAEHGLLWPVDAAPGRSLGGVLAGGADYPGRTGYGPIREWVLGLEVATHDGQRLALGGSTMKNVAGYDLVKLHLGARGTLGAILAATLRLTPRPQQQQWFCASPAYPHEPREQVAAAELAGGRLYLRLDGRREQVERRAAALRRWWPDLAPCSPPHLPGVAGELPAPVRVRLAVPASRVAEAVALCQAAGAAAVAGPALLGLLTAWLPLAAAGSLGRLREQVGALGGQLWLQAAPAQVLAACPARPATAQGTWEERLRTALAPGACFNPHL